MIFRRMDPSRIVDPASDGADGLAPQEAAALAREIVALLEKPEGRTPHHDRNLPVALGVFTGSMERQEAAEQIGVCRQRIANILYSYASLARYRSCSRDCDATEEREVARQRERRERLRHVRSNLGFDFAREWPLNSAMRACHKCQRIVLVRDMNLDRYIDAECPACGRTTQDLVPLLEQALEARPDDRSAWLSHIADMRRRFD